MKLTGRIALSSRPFTFYENKSEKQKTLQKYKHRHFPTDFVQLNFEWGMPKRDTGKQQTTVRKAAREYQFKRNAECWVDSKVYRSSYFRRWRQLVGCANAPVIGILTSGTVKRYRCTDSRQQHRCIHTHTHIHSSCVAASHCPCVRILYVCNASVAAIRTGG